MRTFSLLANFTILLPAVIFIIGYVNPYFSVPFLLLFLYWLWQRVHEFGQHKDTIIQQIYSIKNYIPELSIAALMASLWLLPSGVGGVGYINHDENMTNTTFSLLINDKWPVWFTPDYLGEKFNYKEPRPLVYYFGYYLPAALMGKLFGWSIGQLSLFVWTWLCIFVLFMLLLMHIKQQNARVKPILYALFFILFSLYGGLDWWANSILKSTPERSEIWGMPFVFLSNTRLLYWASHNTIAVWLLMCLLLEGIKEPWQAKLLGPVVVAVLIWTPIGLIGVVPFLLLFFFMTPREQRIHFFNGWSIVVSIGLFIFLAAFITANSFSFPVQWLIGADNIAEFFSKYSLFLLVELGASVGVFIITYKNSTVRERWFIGMAYGLLLIIPFLRIGIWNDWCAKTSVASLFIIGFLAAKNIVVRRLPMWQMVAALLLMLMSTFTAGEELLIAISEFKINVRNKPHPFSTYGQWYATEQRIGKAHSFFYDFLAKENQLSKKSNR